MTLVKISHENSTKNWLQPYIIIRYQVQSHRPRFYKRSRPASWCRSGAAPQGLPSWWSWSMAPAPLIIDIIVPTAAVAERVLRQPSMFSYRPAVHSCRRQYCGALNGGGGGERWRRRRTSLQQRSRRVCRQSNVASDDLNGGAAMTVVMVGRDIMTCRGRLAAGALAQGFSDDSGLAVSGLRVMSKTGACARPRTGVNEMGITNKITTYCPLTIYRLFSLSKKMVWKI